jgi:hypothetical protein
MRNYFNQYKLTALATVFTLMLLACRTVPSNYINEKDILYVERMTNKGEECFYYADRFGRKMLPVSKNAPDGYKVAKPFSCGLARIMDKDGKWKYIDTEGRVVIDASEYDMCWSFEETTLPSGGGLTGLAYVNKGYNMKIAGGLTNEESNGKYGLINTKGEVVLPVEYDAIYGFNTTDAPLDRIWWIKKNGLYGAINEKAQLIIPLQYTDVELFSYGKALVKTTDKWGIIDIKGKTIVPFKFSDTKPYSNSKAEYRILAKEGNYWGIIDNKGKIILPFLYVKYEDNKSPADVIKMFTEDGRSILWNKKEDRIL